LKNQVNIQDVENISVKEFTSPHFSLPLFILIYSRVSSLCFHVCAFILLMIFSTVNIYGQKFLTDTIYVEFSGDSLPDISHLCIKYINDNRNEDPNFIMYQTKNKLLLFPADQEVHLTKPLTEAFLEGFTVKDDCPVSYTLEINKFEILKRKGRFATSTFLIADIPVYQSRNDSLYFFGTLYYDHLYRPLKKKESLTESAVNLLQSWHSTFKTDMVTLSTRDQKVMQEISPNFITNPSIRPLLMNIQSGIFGGRKWYGFQGEIFFTRPETNKNSKYVSGIIRYQNNPDYESLAIGRNSEHFTFRQDKNLVFDIDLNILLGFLKWKNLEANTPSIYQIINAEVSSVQNIVYNRQNKQGFTARIGTMETLGYIYDKKLRFQIGGFAGFGYKF